MDSILQDIRFALRMLAKSPIFSAVAVLVLALGIGANTAMFSVVDSILLTPLPYRAPDRLVSVQSVQPLVDPSPLSGPDFHDYRDQSTSFDSMTATTSNSLTLAEGEAPSRIAALYVTTSYFQVFDVTPLLGRTFAEDEGTKGKDAVIVMSHGLWQARFGSDPKIVGRSIVLNDKPFTVIGVLPKTFHDEDGVEAWVPSVFEGPNLKRGSHFLRAFGRLKPGVSVSAASAELAQISTRLEEQYPDSDQAVRARCEPLREFLVKGVKPALMMLLGAIVFVLLIACANVANLLLARASARQTEIAIRVALGATRGRIVRQLLTESVVLGVFGGGLGLLLSLWGVDLLVSVLQSNVPHVAEVGLDVRVLLFTLGVSLLTGIAFGLAPAMEASRLDVHTTIKEGGARATSSSRRNVLRNALVVGEIALALVLLAGAGVLAHSFERIGAVDPGFRIDGVHVFAAQLPPRYEGDKLELAFDDRVLANLRAIPGVDDVAIANTIPLSGNNTNGDFDIEGRPPWPPGGSPISEFRVVTPGYFSTFGVPLRAGRLIDDTDRIDSRSVVVINESMAKRFWPDESPIGKRIKIEWGNSDPMREIVGIVADSRANSLKEAPRYETYFPMTQESQGFLSFAIRSSLPHAALMAQARSALRDVDPKLPIAFDMTMSEVLSSSLARERTSAILLGAFAAAALVLAAIGVFGVMAYSVGQRTREIGIRVALGASPGDVVRLVLNSTAALVALGLAIGLPVAFLTMSALRTLVFGVSPADPSAFGAAAALLAFVAFLASWFPARRATQVTPMVALRAE